jgi:NACHT domain
MIGLNNALLTTLIIAGIGGLAAIGRELWKRWQERITDGVDHLLLRAAARFGRRYREFLLGSLRFTDLKGLATVGYYTPELDEVFVDVSLVHQPPHRVTGGVVAERSADVVGRRSIQEFLGRPEPQVLAVVGAPGSGKTTLLRHTARQLCRRSDGARRNTPILLYLRDHVTTIVTTPEVALPELVRGTLGDLARHEPTDWFEKQLVEGNCVVLIDGLDEVATQADRRLVADWVESQTDHYPKNHFVITSRPQGFKTTPVSGATVLQARGFTREQVTQFIRGWYAAVDRHGAETEFATRQHAKADDLLERLNRTAGLFDLTVNPLLLTMICNVHRYRNALPGSRADLYGEICQVILWRRQEAKKLPLELDGDKKETLLRALAFTMMKRRVRDLPLDEVISAVRPGLRRLSRDVTPEQFMADVSSNGLLVERENGSYSFAHLTFQEYLAASHIRDKNRVEVLVDGVDDVWWRETTLLYAAKADADEIVEACLRSGSVTALSLGVDCGEQGSELAPELRERLDKLVETVLEPTVEPEHRRLMAGVLVVRHLRDLVPTESGGRVCPRPITRGLFELYLRDTDPAHRAGAHADSTAPMVGVPANDSFAFMKWVNRLVGGEVLYRLANRGELDDPAVRTALTAPHLSAWLEPGAARRSELWVAEGHRHPYLVEGATMVRQITKDMERSESTLRRLLLMQAVASSQEVERMLTPKFGQTRDLKAAARHAQTAMHACSRASTAAHGLAQALSWQLEIKNGDTTARKRAEQLAQVLEREVAIAQAHDDDLGRDLVFARTLAHMLALNLPRTAKETPVMGRALSGALESACGRPASSPGWPERFSHAFARATEAEQDVVVYPDRLAELVREGRDGLASLGDAEWTGQVAHRLANVAMPVFTRQERPSADDATAIRLAALCLAAELDGHPLGEVFRRIAAGVTLLELRASGEAPPTETIILTAV